MSWWQRLWRRNQLEDQLEKELRFHLDRHIADLMARGHSPEEARRQARLALGGPDQVKEHCRDARGTSVMRCARCGSGQIGYWTTPVQPPENQQPLVSATSVTPDYLRVMGIPLRRGRFFNDQDRLGNEGVVVIDDVMAQEAFHGQEPIGKHLWIGLGSDPMRVVGVVGHVRYWGLAGDDTARVRAQLYYPFAQVPDPLVRRWSELMSIAIRTSIPPTNVLAPLRRELRGATGDQVLYEVFTLERLAHDSLARQRFLMLWFGIFAGLALTLACIGIYGVLAYLTGRRVPEIGVRMARGASGGNVVRMVLRQSLGMIFLGVDAGTGAAWAAGRVWSAWWKDSSPPGHPLSP